MVSTNMVKKLLEGKLGEKKGISRLRWMEDVE